jgi:hypothetical protein
MIRLEAHSLRWVHGDLDDPDDQCAHGDVEFVANGTTLVPPGEADWTLSAAALYLLRALTSDHTADAPVAEANFLFPCCGFTAWAEEGRYPVVLVGCPRGVDVWVSHGPGGVSLSSQAGEETVSEEEWKAAVLGFVGQVEEFYRQCSPKWQPLDEEDRAGWAIFWGEWNERVAEATGDDRLPFNPIANDG